MICLSLIGCFTFKKDLIIHKYVHVIEFHLYVYSYTSSGLSSSVIMCETTSVVQLVEFPLCMWEIGVQTLGGSDPNLKIGSDCHFAKHSAFRNLKI